MTMSQAGRQVHEGLPGISLRGYIATTMVAALLGRTPDDDEALERGIDVADKLLKRLDSV